MTRKLNHVERLARARANGILTEGGWVTTVVHKPACRYQHPPETLLKCRCGPQVVARNIDTGRVIEIGPKGELLGRGRVH